MSPCVFLTNLSLLGARSPRLARGGWMGALLGAGHSGPLSVPAFPLVDLGQLRPPMALRCGSWSGGAGAGQWSSIRPRNLRLGGLGGPWVERRGGREGVLLSAGPDPGSCLQGVVDTLTQTHTHRGRDKCTLSRHTGMRVTQIQTLTHPGTDIHTDILIFRDTYNTYTRRSAAPRHVHTKVCMFKRGTHMHS